MILRTAICALATLGATALCTSSAQAQVVVVGGAPVYGSTVVVARPVVPAVAVPAYVPSVYSSSYSVGYPSSVGYPTYSAGYAGYSTYRPVVPAPVVSAAYVAPVVTYRPVTPAVVPVYPAYRPGVVTAHTYYPGQPVRNALRVLAP
jgi:hypothetical protein